MGLEEPSPKRELVTRLLHEWSKGDQRALDELVPLVYDQLRKVAGRCLASEPAPHTLSATALVHEAYLRLVDSGVAWQSRVHFFAVAAGMLRRILVDHARAHRRHKRGAGANRIAFDESIMVGPQVSDEILEIDEALQRLTRVDPRKSEIVQLLFFGGLTYDETAAALGISPATVHRELKMAKAWLYQELAQESV